jgi:NAD(P)-dependent dehydrogenase (short-subunit alcohol dehydrogenase family)
MTQDSRFSLNGKVALVTGGSQGIGRATAIEFAKYGADVAIASRKLPDLEKVAEEIRGLGRKALPVSAHIGKMDDVKRLVETVKAEMGGIDILVNNAATSPTFTTVLDAEERLWDSIMNLNLKGLYFLTQAVARIMKEQGRGGSIINVSSIDGHKPQVQVGIYSISKAAVDMTTKSTALELAPYRIRVNGIAPGATRTKIFDALFASLPKEKIDEQMIQIGNVFPLKRIAVPDDMVGAMLFLASEASCFMTGETILIDGGMHLL